MSFAMYAGSAGLILVALALLIVPMLRHRSEPGVSLSMVGVLLGFPLLVGLMYFSVTTYEWDAAPPASVAAEGEGVNEMILDLARRMETNPEREGLVLLARSYASLGRFEDAVDAWNAAWELTQGQDPDINIAYAEALILADQRTLRTSAADLLENALRERPDDPRALWYGGLSAASRGNEPTAASRWTRLLQMDLPPEFRNVVQQQLSLLSVEVDVPDAPPVTSVGVRVSLDAALPTALDDNARLFVIARDRDQPRPPIAVKRLRVGAFPVEVSISDNDVMTGNRRLGNIENLEIVARISRTGEPLPVDGDVYGEALAKPDTEGNLKATVSMDRTVGSD